MAVMDEKVSAESGRGEVVDAARAVSDVTEDEDVVSAGESAEDVGEREREHEEALGELEGDTLGRGGEREDAVDAFVDLEVVVGWEERD